MWSSTHFPSTKSNSKNPRCLLRYNNLLSPTTKKKQRKKLVNQNKSANNWEKESERDVKDNKQNKARTNLLNKCLLLSSFERSMWGFVLVEEQRKLKKQAWWFWLWFVSWLCRFSNPIKALGKRGINLLLKMVEEAFKYKTWWAFFRALVKVAIRVFKMIILDWNKFIKKE